MTISLTAAHGAQVKMYVNSSFTAIEGIFNGPNGPSWEAQMIEGRYHSSTTSVKKASYVNVGNVTFSIYVDTTDPVHLALLAAARAKTQCQFQMVLTDTGSEAYGFTGYVSASFKGEVDNFNVYDITILIDSTIAVS